MKPPLDSPFHPQPSSTLARVSRMLEYFSVFVFLFGVLFMLQSWPYAEELMGIAYLGLGIAYAVLFTIRLTGLKLPLGQKNYTQFMVAGISLGLAFGLAGIVELVYLVYYSKVLFYALEGVRIAGIIGVVASLFYMTSNGQGAPNTLFNAVASWLYTRLLIVSFWMGIGLVVRLCLGSF